MKSKNKLNPLSAYKLASLAAEKHVKDLLSRMTLAEKAAQKLVDVQGNFEQSDL